MKVDLDFPTIARAIRSAPLPTVDLVVGIARGGVVPASLVAYELRRDLAVLHLNYRDDANTPRHAAPVLLHPFHLPDGVRRVLLVDDVAVSGATLNTAQEVLASYDVTTLVLKGRADLVLFPEIRSCVNWPWNPTSSLSWTDAASSNPSPP